MYDSDRRMLVTFLGGITAMMAGAAIVYFVVTRYYPEKLSPQVPPQDEVAPTNGPADAPARP